QQSSDQRASTHDRRFARRSRNPLHRKGRARSFVAAPFCRARQTDPDGHGIGRWAIERQHHQFHARSGSRSLRSFVVCRGEKSAASECALACGRAGRSPRPRATAMIGFRTVRNKLLLVVLATNAAALSITAVLMVMYDLHTFRETLQNDLSAQADVLGLAAGPALEFDDPQAAKEYLGLLRAKPNINTAAIYTSKGALFATYSATPEAHSEFPKIPEGDGYNIRGAEVTLSKRVIVNNEILGTVYFSAAYEPNRRLRDYVGILGLVLDGSLAVTVLTFMRIQKTVTGPILDVTAVARRVMDERDFSLRAHKTTADEVGVLVDAFNSMLAEIGSRTATLEESKQSLRTLNAELEQRVADRTSQLQEANKELESFSYSVSHDLRAPIRAIGGFCALLVKDHEAQLDTEARRKLGVIKGEAARMAMLIDDLLAFSRLGRKALQATALDMRELATKAYDQLRRDQGDRKVEFRLGALPTAVGDRSLFEQVWVNLLSNAVKFSSKKEAATIEVGAISEEREHVYFVRDNGAGFDPRYGKNLFGVFQRLHGNDEFPGTGVGLALVHRIVSRHGGRVWADGKLGEGATFHFTVPKEACSGTV